MFINEFSIDKAVRRTRVNQSGKMSIRRNGNIRTKNIGGITFFGRNGVRRKSTVKRNRGRQVRVGNRKRKRMRIREGGHVQADHSQRMNRLTATIQSCRVRMVAG